MQKVNKTKLLLVEDEESLGYLLTEYLGMKNFEVSWAKNGKEALPFFEKQNFDLVILDVMMPEMDGFTLASKIKDKYPGQAFLFLTAKSLKVDVLKGFALGAVDYLRKPIDEEELVARIKAITTRLGVNNGVNTGKDVFQLGKYSFDSKNQKLSLSENYTFLTSRENDILKMLASNKNSLTTHRDILINLWGNNDYFNRKSLNVFITRLRNYLKEDESVQIENVHGQGFVLRVAKITE